MTPIPAVLLTAARTAALINARPLAASVALIANVMPVPAVPLTAARAVAKINARLPVVDADMIVNVMLAPAALLTAARPVVKEVKSPAALRLNMSCCSEFSLFCMTIS